MKKILAISSAFLLLGTALTGCGENMDDGDYAAPNGSVVDSRRDTQDYRDERDNGSDHSASDHVNDAIDGIEDAGEDIVEGVGDAAGDIVDGLDGNREPDSTRTTTR